MVDDSYTCVGVYICIYKFIRRVREKKNTRQITFSIVCVLGHIHLGELFKAKSTLNGKYLLSLVYSTSILVDFLMPNYIYI